MIFICDIIIYPLIKKNKFNCVFLSLNIVIVSKNLKKLTNNVSLSNEKKKKIYKHSWCVRVRCRTRWNPSRPVETRRNPFRLTRLNPSKHVQTCYVSSRPNEFSIFIFLFYIFYFIPPPPSSSSSSIPPIPPNFPPSSPYSFFVFIWGWGGERAGDGDGTGGEPPPPPPAGRSVAPPPKGGGTKSPPPSPSNKKKQNLQIKRHIYSRQ